MCFSLTCKLPDDTSFCCVFLQEKITENTEEKKDSFPEVIDSTQFIRSLETQFIPSNNIKNWNGPES